jgi:hypothetical protein
LAGLGELIFQQAILVFEPFRLSAQRLNFSTSFGRLVGFVFASDFQSILPNLGRPSTFPSPPTTGWGIAIIEVGS